MNEFFLSLLKHIFTESTPRPFQSISCNVSLFVCHLSSLSATGTEKARDFWSKSVLLSLKM